MAAVQSAFTTLGVLNEIEAMIAPRLLSEHFDLIFGTSTGAIIAALLALGSTVAEVHTSLMLQFLEAPSAVLRSCVC